MRGKSALSLALCLAAAAPLLSAPAPSAQALSAANLTAGSWFLSLSPGARDDLKFFAVEAADAGRLYLRRFATPSFYLDALAGTDLKVLLWPEAKKRSLSFGPEGNSFTRETSPFKVDYKRSGAAPKGAPLAYEGDWTVGEPAMTVSIRACEKRSWAVVMYFPGDPSSGIPMGYYPLAPVGDGVFRSSSAFPDSYIELEYDPASDALVIRPLFKERPLAAGLYDPVRAWRAK
jgi:hypothetical protein